jgi:cell division protease FtsH
MFLRSTRFIRLRHNALPPYIQQYLPKIDPPSIERKITTIPYSKFIKKIQNEEVKDVVIKQDLSELLDDKDDRVILPNHSNIIEFLFDHDIGIKVVKGTDMQTVLLWVIQIVFFFLLMRGVIGKAQIPGLSTKFKPIEDEVDVRFDDVAGIDAAKQDLQELVSFLREPEKYAKIGAKIPKGVLLVGPSGVGKTLLARAVAGESGVPFFSCSASEFIELFVGMGASRIRDLFKKASENAPCIIFIDELDAIGKKRNMNTMNGTEQDQTLNQLLTELDGFNNNRGIIVIGATNRVDVLDDALLRPGRFDRKVFVELPDIKGRVAILKVHTEGKPLDINVNLEKVARITVGFSGADLANLVNEAAILSVRNNQNEISTTMFELALEKITIGEERRTTLISETKKKTIAYHEAGHALMGILMNDFDIVRKVSIVPRGRTGGVTYFEPHEDRLDINLLTREYLENRIMVALGGRVAEEIVFGTMKITSGASGDLEVVNQMAREMVSNYGFNETMGPVQLDGIADITKAAVDREVKYLVEKLYNKAKNSLLTYEFYLHRIAEALIEKETLNEEDLRNMTLGIGCDYMSNDGGF